MLRTVAVLLTLASSATGCLILDSSDESTTVQGACRAVCDCQLVSPAAVQSCTDQCVAQVSPGALTETCLSCLAESECLTVQAGGCEPVCGF